MTFESRPWVPTAFERESAASETQTRRALSMRHGGTGVSAVGANDADRAADILKTWGMLDSGLLVPRAMLPALTAADASNPGQAGAAPAPAAGKQRQALTGGAAYSTELEVSSIVSAAGDKKLDIEGLGDLGNRLYVAATASSTRSVRLGARSTSNQDLDVSIEPLGRGRVSDRGDPLLQTLRPFRAVTALSLGTSFSVVGLPTPTIDTPGAAAGNVADANGNYVSMTNDGTTPLPSGIIVPACTQRRWEPAVIFVFRSALVDSRLWLGMFTADPWASSSLGSIAGAGVRVDAAIDSNLYQFVTSNGTSQTTTPTAQAPTANAIQAIRVRFLDGTQGFEAAFYDFNINAWTNHITQATNMPGTTTTLGIYLRLTSETGVNRAVSLKTLTLHQR